VINDCAGSVAEMVVAKQTLDVPKYPLTM